MANQELTEEEQRQEIESLNKQMSELKTRVKQDLEDAIQELEYRKSELCSQLNV